MRKAGPLYKHQQFCLQRLNSVLNKDSRLIKGTSVPARVRATPKTSDTAIYAPTAVLFRSQPRASRPTALHFLSKMCVTKLSKHPGCGHWSCAIEAPCKEGRDFSNCPSFTTGAARKPAKYQRELAKEGTCPKCDQKDNYDGKKIRMVKGTAHATKLGCGPSVSHLLQAFSSYLYYILSRETGR